MRNYEGGDVSESTAPHPSLEDMQNSIPVLFAAQQAVLESPSVQRYNLATETTIFVLSEDADGLPIYTRPGEGEVEALSGELDRYWAMPANLISGIVAEHLGFGATADHHYAQLRGTPQEDFPRAKGLERDNSLCNFISMLNIPPSIYDATRIVAQEIQNPIIASQAFSLLYLKGDSGSLQPFLERVGSYAERLAAGSDDFIEAHLLHVLKMVGDVGEVVMERELGDRVPSDQRRANLDQIRPSLERLRILMKDMRSRFTGEPET